MLSHVASHAKHEFHVLTYGLGAVTACFDYGLAVKHTHGAGDQHKPVELTPAILPSRNARV